MAKEIVFEYLILSIQDAYAWNHHGISSQRPASC